ncbi:DNA cytosine methyltransferase [Mesorhizobium abyssinicae]|uniref:Cytosine-specific methyltransferase n=1 Tax=Mesorhizobium abyssinicae TaxID=1209958 RepID=A0ABU5AW17_9HYPH|nr:DNA cytosine methyltransferase [Mesorhizobium abyssinicae]MDX8541473.1 DNA cytosine methyltransferase [Mesorhizobium abyssinicae]
MRSISLFSGCGGLDLGLHDAGFQTILASDLERLCAESWRRNMPAVPFLGGRIGTWTRAEVASALGGTIGEVDLVAGGPPCPPFSKSRFYRKEKPRALEDPNGWETIDGYLSMLDWVRPRAFILENVKGLAYKVHAEALETIIARAEKLGYKVTTDVLNAADYGVPQIRERCFVVGSLDARIEWPKPTHSNKPSSGLPPWVTAGVVLHDLDTEENASDEGHFAGGQHHNLLREVPPGDNYLYFTEKRGHPSPIFKWRGRYWSFLLKLSPDMPSWTIQARRSNNMGPFHWRNRILRISEIKRLQTFPDSFDLAGTLEQQWRQVGNAVPPMLAAAVGRSIASAIDSRLRDAA